MTNPTRAQAGYGNGVVSIEGSFVDTSELLERILTTLTSPTYEAPMLPAAAFRLMELSRQPDVSIPEIVQVLETDPLIAGKVLRVAQSPVFARGAPLQSLRDAVVRLGLETLLQVLLEVSMAAKVFRAPGYDEPMERLRAHSSATAQIARLVCNSRGIDSEYAFLCGLLHDVGVAAATMILVPQGRAKPPIPFAIAWPAILEVHEQASKIVCASWRLPEDVQAAIGCHEHPIAAGTFHPVGAAIHVASWIATRLGYGLVEDERMDPPERELRALGITQPQLVMIVQGSKQLAARIPQVRSQGSPPAAGR